MRTFGATTTTDEVLEGTDMTGRRVVITGAASGLGLESARALAAHRASVTVLARSGERAAEAQSAVEALVPGTSVEAGVVDLGDLASICRFTDGYLSRHDAIVTDLGRHLDEALMNEMIEFSQKRRAAATDTVEALEATEVPAGSSPGFSFKLLEAWRRHPGLGGHHS